MPLNDRFACMQLSSEIHYETPRKIDKMNNIAYPFYQYKNTLQTLTENEFKSKIKFENLCTRVFSIFFIKMSAQTENRQCCYI